MTAEELKQEMAAVGLSIKQVAELAGITQHALYQRLMHKKVSNETITKVLAAIEPYKQKITPTNEINELRREVNELRAKVEELTNIIYNREKDNG